MSDILTLLRAMPHIDLNREAADEIEAYRGVMELQKKEIERLRAKIAEYETVMGPNTPISAALEGK